MSSNEVFENNIAAIRVDLNDLKNNFNAAVTRLDADIRALAAKFEAEIRRAAEKAESDLEKFAGRIVGQLTDMRQDTREMRAEDKALRDRIDGNYQTFNATIGASHEKLSEKIDRVDERLNAKIDEVDEKLSAKIDAVDERLNAKIDAVDEKLSGKIDATNAKLSDLDDKVTNIGSKQTALLWVVGVLGTVITLAVTVGQAFHWF